MKRLTKLGILVAVAAVAVMAQPVFAACAGANLAAQEPENFIGINGAAPYSYTGGERIGANFQAAFWSAGAGDPALMAGNDSGSLGGFDLVFSPSGNLGTVDFGAPYLYFNQFFSNWGAGGVDGCINSDGPTACTCFLVTDDGTDGTGYAAVGSAQRDANGDFKLAANLDLRPLPKPMIVSSQAGTSGVNMMVTVPPLTEGLSLDPNCANACVGSATYRLFQITLPSTDPMPEARDLSLWTEISAGPTAVGQNSMVTVDCSAGNTSTWLTSVINFDPVSGFENVNVSGNSSLVTCDPTLAEPVEIERPGRRPERPERGAKQGRVR